MRDPTFRGLQRNWRSRLFGVAPEEQEQTGNTELGKPGTGGIAVAAAVLAAGDVRQQDFEFEIAHPQMADNTIPAVHPDEDVPPF